MTNEKEKKKKALFLERKLKFDISCGRPSQKT